MLTELESGLFEVAYHHFLRKLEYLKIFKKQKFSHGGWGIENWFQNELLFAWESAGFAVEVKGKMKKDADLIVNNIGVELRTSKRVQSFKKHRVSVFSQHPKADLYVFLFWETNKSSQRLEEWLQGNDKNYEFRDLGHGWKIWACKSK
jgi:hypothetical protein